MAMQAILLIIGIWKILFGRRVHKCGQCKLKFDWLSKDGVCEKCLIENSIEQMVEESNSDEVVDYFDTKKMSWKVLGTSDESMFEIVFGESDDGTLIIGSAPSSGAKEDIDWRILGIG